MSDPTDDETLSADTDASTSWAVVIGVFLLAGFGSTLLVPDSNFVSFIIVGCIGAAPFWILLTESSATWWVKEVMDSTPEAVKKSSGNTKSHSSLICKNCGWQNSQENNYCHDCGTELENSEPNDDSFESISGDDGSDGEAESEVATTKSGGTETKSGDNGSGNGPYSREANKSDLAAVGSIFLGVVFGFLFLFTGRFTLAIVTILIAFGWPFLLTRHGRESMRRWLGMPKNPKYNKPASSTKECTECGWHNHQANNNCVECDAGFE